MRGWICILYAIILLQWNISLSIYTWVKLSSFFLSDLWLSVSFPYCPLCLSAGILHSSSCLTICLCPLMSSLFALYPSLVFALLVILKITMGFCTILITEIYSVITNFFCIHPSIPYHMCCSHTTCTLLADFVTTFSTALIGNMQFCFLTYLTCSWKEWPFSTWPEISFIGSIYSSCPCCLEAETDTKGNCDHSLHQHIEYNLANPNP